MRTRRIFEWSLAGFLLAVAAGCGSGAAGGSAASNPSDPANLDGGAASVSMTFQAVSGGAAALTTTDATGATVDLTSASMTIERIDIKLPDGQSCSGLSVTLPAFASCEDAAGDDSPGTDDSADDSSDDDKIRLTGPFTVNLLTGESTPSLADITLPSGIVKEIKVRVADLTAEGTVDGSPFSLNLNFHEDIEFHDVSGFEISEAVSLNQVVISFDVSKWLSGVDLASCGSGAVKVDDESEDSCSSEIEDQVRNNIEDSGSAAEEDDHSGEGSGTDDPATHDVGDDAGADDPATHDVGDDSGGAS